MSESEWQGGTGVGPVEDRRNGTRVASSRCTKRIPPVNDPIDSRQLQVFLCLANKGSLKAAGAELFLTSSAISHSITNLETNLGVQLFHRSGKGLLLTDNGRHLVKESIGILARMQSLRRALAGEDSNETGSLQIAAGHNFVCRFMPDVAREFQECFSRMKFQVRASDRDACLELLRTQEIHAAILVDPPDDGPEFVYTRLFDDELRLVLPARNPLAKLEVVPVSSLGGKTLVVTRRQSYTVRSTLERIRGAGVELRDCIEVGAAGTVIEMVKAGLGIGLLPDWVAPQEEESPTVAVRSVGDLKLRRVWGYVRPRWSRPGLADRTLLRICQQAVAALPRACSVFCAGLVACGV